METLKYAQDLIKANGNVCSGFNQFVNGSGYPKRGDYGDKNQWYSETQGYDYAKEMAKNEGLSFVHIFECGQSKCSPFNYGGFIVCNTCGKNNVEKEWWKIKVEKDGNEYCCHGLDFVNLQESNNYAFALTFELAIENYGRLMLKS